MDNVTADWVSTVLECMRELQDEYSRIRGLILTEGDLECLLFQKLYTRRIFDYAETSISNWMCKPIHSQVTWFKEAQQSGFRMDLTIIDPGKIDINRLDTVADFPNKGFFYDGECVGIELKFIRYGSSSSVRTSALEDYNHIMENVIPAKKWHVNNGTYTIANRNNVAFVIVVGCKSEEIYNMALNNLEDAVKLNNVTGNVFVFVFSHTRCQVLYS